MKRQRKIGPPSLYTWLAVLWTCAAGCGTGGGESITGDWKGTVTEEDGAAVVRTQTGSVWGGEARLEERFTLDADGAGPPLADVRGIAATADRIYVLDVMESSLHIYDSTGVYLETVGRTGEGPGEFQRPVDLALDAERGTLYVRDAMLRRITLFRLDGSLLTPWSTPTVPGLLRPMVVTDGDGLYLPITLNPTDPPGEWRYGMASFGPEGPRGDTVAAPEVDCPGFELSFAGTTRGSIALPVPFSPEEVWTLTPGRWTVSGCSDHYRVTLRSPDGERRILQRDSWEPVPVTELEAEWSRGMMTARIRLDDPTWTWRGGDVPDAKPAFQAFFTDPQGRLWVLRPGPGRELPDGLQSPEDPLDFLRRPRWENTHLLDAFDPEGRFLGQVVVPDEIRFRPLPWIDDDRLLALWEAPSGEVTVRDFRLVTPDQGAPAR